MTQTFDADTAFKPQSKEESAAIALAKKDAVELREKIRDSFALLLQDPKYLLILDNLKKQSQMAVDLLLRMDMNDPARFQLQSDANVLPSIFNKIKNTTP